MTQLLLGKEVEELLRIKRSKRYTLTRDGRLPAVSLGSGVRYPEDGVRAYIASLPKVDLRPQCPRRTSTKKPDVTL